MPKSTVAQPATNAKPEIVSRTPAPKKSENTPEIVAALEELNKKVCVVREIGKVVEYDSTRLKEPNPLTFKAFQFELYANISTYIPDLAQRWVHWKRRREVQAIVYEPGQPLFCGEGEQFLNTWRPSDLIPKKGDLTIWHQYIDHLFALDPTYKEWFIAWLAYPLQHPGTKHHTACVFWSTETGTGKSTIGYIMARLYGEHNFKEIEEADLVGVYNYWAVFRCFIMGDEIRGDKARETANKMKSWITRQVMTVNLKYRAQFDCRDRLNYFFTSNHSDAFFLTAKDRRFFIHHANEVKVRTLMSNRAFNDWLKAGGYEAILHHLLHEVDLAKPIVGGNPDSLVPAPFDPRMDAPRTAARQAMIDAGKDEVDVWLDGIVSPECDTFLGTGWHLASAEDLFGIFNKAYPTARMKHKTFVTAIKNVLPWVRGGNPIPTGKDKPTKSLYCPPMSIRLYEGASLISLSEAYMLDHE